MDHDHYPSTDGPQHVDHEEKLHLQKNHSKFLIPLAALIIGLLIIGGIAFAYFMPQNRQCVYNGVSYHVGDAVPSPDGCNSCSCTENGQVACTLMACEEDLSEPTGDWKTYTNEEYGFETKYNPESAPNEIIGTEEAGQFSYVLTIKFGTNPLKFPNGYEVRVNKQQSIDNYRLELVGHMTDAIDSEEEITISDNTWTKLNYTIFLTTDYIPVTTAVTHRNDYSYAITSSSQDIDQILSTFKFIEL